LAAFIVQLEYFGLGVDYPERYATLINAVTSEAVVEAARKYVHPEKTVLSVVANLEEVKDIGEDFFGRNPP
jgi:predicted Zn-dependent peptidase